MAAITADRTLTEARGPLRRTERRRVRPVSLLRAIVASPIAWWLLAANLVGLFAVTLLTMSVEGYRERLIHARLDSLLVSGDVIAAAIAAGATVADGTIGLGQGRLEDAARGDVLPASPDTPHPMVRPLVAERVDRLIDRLAGPAGLRARVYGTDGLVIADSSGAPALPDLMRLDPFGRPRRDPPAIAPSAPDWARNLSEWIDREFGSVPLPRYVDGTTIRADAFPEVGDALAGIPTGIARVAEDGRLVLSVAVPIRRLNGIVGAVLLETKRDDITPFVVARQRAALVAFLVGAAILIPITLIGAMSVLFPMRRLARAVSDVLHAQAPFEARGLGGRGDVIGGVARDLTELMRKTNQRIEALEAFAADVAHELKNPLTSLRSACDTLPLASTPEAQAKLIGIIRHDVRRIDRLISDISAASRLDAELSKMRGRTINLGDLLAAVVVVQQELAAKRGQTVSLTIRRGTGRGPLLVHGNDSRLGEVFTNLIDNARSFTSDGRRIEVTAERRGDFIEILVDDEGPGIKEGMLERIFERFYTDRGDAAEFGNNSGLGLSICRQIVDAHGGEIFAENRYTTSLGPDRRVVGARFTVQLPLPG